MTDHYESREITEIIKIIKKHTLYNYHIIYKPLSKRVTSSTPSTPRDSFNFS